MDVLLDEQEALIQKTAGEFLAAESTPALVRACENEPAGFSRDLWSRFAALGWLGLALPESNGGQALPLGCLGLLFEELGRYIAPLPVHATLVPALVIAKHGTGEHQSLLSDVVAGDLILSYAVQELSGRWAADGIQMVGRREGNSIVLSGVKYFVDNFRGAHQCLVAFRPEGSGGGLGAILVDTQSPGIRAQPLIGMARDDQAVVTFDGVCVSANRLLCNGAAAVEDLMDYAAVFLAAQMQGAARRATEMAVAYVSQREAFGQPIGAFQAIQHMAADMINAVDGTQLLAREAIWLLDRGLSARVEVAQAKSFANEKCLMACRAAQQMHGGIGFIAEFDLNLWYRRVTSWSLRAGTTYEHRELIARAVLDTPGNVRLGMVQHLPRPAEPAAPFTESSV